MSSDAAQPRIQHPSFVGRERELGELTAAFDRAVEAEGSLAMVVGEPGIGKTSLCEQLGAHVNGKGGQTLIGHCYEEGSLSLPYLAFVEAMRSYVLERDTDSLRAELGQGAADVARIVPEVRDLLQIEPRDATGADDDRYLLLQTVISFLRNASNAQPLAIVLEDLHDADSGTLDMLTYLSRNLRGTSLLVIGTYRDVEVDRAHPLSNTLAGLHRASSFRRIALRGLGPDEVGRLVSGVAGPEVAQGIAETVHFQTEGNPLFVQEVVRYLADEGLLTEDSGGAAAIAMRIPEGLRDVIGRRLSRLSPECNELLRVAAVIGREFSVDILEPVAGAPEEGLFRSLKEAAAAGLIEERSSVRTGGTYRFAHALFRQTLYEETIAPRRARLHQKIGEAIETAYADRLEDHASELADHFTSATAIDDLTKAAAYGEMAARNAQSVYAYRESVRLLEQSLQVQDVLDPDDKARHCDLLLALGEALMPAGEPRRVLKEIAPQAFALAEAIGDRGRAARSCRIALEAAWQYGMLLVVGSPEGRLWADRADQYAEPNTTDRVLTDLMLGFVQAMEGDISEYRALHRRALELARRLDDPEVLYLASLLFVELTTPQDQKERRQLVTEMAAYPHVGVTANTLSYWLYVAGSACLDWGERARAEGLWEQLRQLAQRTDDANVIYRSLFVQPWLDYLDGRLEEAVTGTEYLLRRANELGAPLRGQMMAGMLGFWPLVYLGRREEAIAAVRETERLAEVERARPQGSVPHLVLSRALLKPSDEAADQLRRLAPEGTQLHRETATNLLVSGLELAVLVEDRELCSEFAEQLAPAASLSTAHIAQSCPARHLGAAYALLREPDKARAYYLQALEAAGKIRFRPEIALTRLQLAELLLESYPDPSTSSGQANAEALEHLEFAIAEFRDMKMQPSLERALALKEKAESGPVSSPAYPDRLTGREVEVLRLIAAGRSNPQIAGELVVSIRTVTTHVTNIFSKIGAANRAEAATYAIRQGLD